MSSGPAEPPVDEVLHGGVANAGAVVRRGDEVLRPANPHTPIIHALLRHVRARGFLGVPEPIGLTDDGRERLRFIPGDVPLDPFPAWSRAPEALASATALLRGLHDAADGFAAPAGLTWSDELADPDPSGDGPAVICHNDVCPENVVFRDGIAVALLDLDFAAPGRPTHDLAALARMCVPVEEPTDAARRGPLGPGLEASLAAVLDGYGPSPRVTADGLVSQLDRQVLHGGAFVQRRIAAGETPFIEMFERSGGAARLERRRRWWLAQREGLAERIVGGRAS